jgi:hypothetical protein
MDSYYSDLLETTKKLDDMTVLDEKEDKNSTKQVIEPTNIEEKKSIPETSKQSRIDLSESFVSVTGYKIGKPVLFSVVVDSNDGTYEIWRRYKQFLALHTALQSVTKRYTFPQFPQKLILGNKNEENVKKRMNMLDVYLQRVSGELEFIKTDAYKKFIQK